MDRQVRDADIRDLKETALGFGLISSFCQMEGREEKAVQCAREREIHLGSSPGLLAAGSRLQLITTLDDTRKNHTQTNKDSS